MFKVIPIFIAVVFVMIISFYIFVGCITFKGVNYIQKNGLKSVVNQIWEGVK